MRDVIWLSSRVVCKLGQNYAVSWMLCCFYTNVYLLCNPIQLDIPNLQHIMNRFLSELDLFLKQLHNIVWKKQILLYCVRDLMNIIILYCCYYKWMKLRLNTKLFLFPISEQKAQVVRLIEQHTKKRTVAIGDGGNDVPMIQAASAGIGLVGKEGKQASLAADWSLTQFCHISRLLLVHGRNSYKRCVHISVSIGFWSFILGFAIFYNWQII